MSCAIGRERHFFLFICINLQGVEDLRTKMDSECLHSSFIHSNATAVRLLTIVLTAQKISGRFNSFA